MSNWKRREGKGGTKQQQKAENEQKDEYRDLQKLNLKKPTETHNYSKFKLTSLSSEEEAPIY